MVYVAVATSEAAKPVAVHMARYVVVFATASAVVKT
jgi:hypothetical protein